MPRMSGKFYHQGKSSVILGTDNEFYVVAWKPLAKKGWMNRDWVTFRAAVKNGQRLAHRIRKSK